MVANDFFNGYTGFPANDFTLGRVEYLCSEWFCILYCENRSATLFIPNEYVNILIKR